MQNFQPLLIRHFGMQPTEAQQGAFRQLDHFLNRPQSCFILRGYAGTGKTSVIAALVNALPAFRRSSVLLAPTGRAAKVMSSYSGRKASTIHRKIYRKKRALDPASGFELANNLHEYTLFVVDEASMLSEGQAGLYRKSLLEDLIRYVKSGKACQLLLVGDTAQLPPVGMTESPALSDEHLKGYGYEVFSCELDQVVRQGLKSGILYNATLIRNEIALWDGQASGTFPILRPGGFPDIFRMGGDRLIEGLHYAYQKFGMDQTLVICRSNKNANLYNQHIRHQILFHEEELTGGDQVMIVKNNYYWSSRDKEGQGFIANGEMAKVRRVRNSHEQHGFRFADVVLEFVDDDDAELECRVILNTLNSDAPQLSQSDQQQLYEQIMKDYEDLPSKGERMQALKEDPYYNALQLKFSMAVTGHKAQGGQWEAVFVDQGFLTEERLDKDFLRWLYTAFTRATRQLFLLNFNDRFFEESVE